MKDTYIKFRCSGSEKEKIGGMAQRAGTTTSEYCRQQSLSGRILANKELSLDEISYFKALKEHNNGFARLANLIRNRDSHLHSAITEYLEQSRELYNRFF